MDRRTVFAVGSFVVSAILTRIGTFSGLRRRPVLAVAGRPHRHRGRGRRQFWVIVPRFDGGTGGAALVTAIISVVSLAVVLAFAG